ncbi:succinylglutamate desuccinylase/aspartoacylase family protein [Roseovarius sp. LXJ103]|uniref:succinylglutamate desuccinylase/aspartoacylase family protein n=1 Tax=Roseovarius carneus TaxID=2853164 RepID=UPI000D6108C4|nr:succinylglutamate desuccinylase/aspartoacylase family protein [Roseovarius carneus]MBZ8118662.1 succinylglutamate desuccinylase/aspartoacylase family protein [Roseovarius carneus]PWE35655.1 succinylglutamate desuccinylase [Pelagicola sp. LXJ1103]
MPHSKPFEISGTSVAPGTRRTVDIPVSTLSDHTPVNLSVHVIHGRKPGPVMFVSAAIHGDEVIGAEIVRRLLRAAPLKSMAGTLMTVPIVNTYGFLNNSRYLPDRRDLNRCFPGGSGGSMAARLADIFMREVVMRADIGIDLHSAAIHRTNLPQLRLTPGNPRLEALARAFAAPVMLNSKLREGSLRMAAEACGVDVLLYEAGEGLRFDELAARAGVSGILRVMRHLEMVPQKGVPRARAPSVMCARSEWCRAPVAGLFRGYLPTGAAVEEGTVLGAISDPFGETEVEIASDIAGIIIGRSNMPGVYEGDALFHIAETLRGEAAADGVTAHLDAAPLYDEDEII